MKNTLSGPAIGLTFSLVTPALSSCKKTYLADNPTLVKPATPAASSWATGQEFLQGVRINAIIESGHMLFLGTNSGIYFKKI